MMKQAIESILAAVDRDERSRDVAAKAVALARMSGARLELFHCDAEQAYSRVHQYDPSAALRAKEYCLAESHRFLDSLWHSLAIHDVEPAMSVGCESPLYEGILHAIERGHPDLVVRGVGEGRTRGPAGLDANDWELVRTCPSPLFLTRGRPWKTPPVVAAAIDLSANEPAEITQTILRTAAAIARSAGGELDILHASRFGAEPSREIESRRAALAGRAKSAGVEAQHIHIVNGEPVLELPRFAAQRDFDLIVLGALTHRKTLTVLVGTLTGKLIETIDSDFLLLKPSCGRSSDRDRV